jgi:hypothetical protein
MQFVSWSNLIDCLNVIVKRCGAHSRPFSSPANEPCSCCENDLQSPSVFALVEGICKAIDIPRSPLIPESMRASLQQITDNETTASLPGSSFLSRIATHQLSLSHCASLPSIRHSVKQRITQQYIDRTGEDTPPNLSSNNV